MDLWDVDIRRVAPFQANPRYLRDRTVEMVGVLYAMHWPFRQPETARGVRRSALHDRLAARGACFGAVMGWERPNWYASPGMEPAYRYSFGRQNWFPCAAEEHRAVREAVGLFDQSSFAKFRLEGPDATAVLQRLCANDVDVPPGRIVYTAMLNRRGGIECDLTVTRLAEDAYFIVTAAAASTHDAHWIRRHLGDARAVLTDVTSAHAVVGVMGPRARTFLARLTEADLTNGGFPFGASREIWLASAPVRATRITYVGELGWELYIPTEFARACTTRSWPPATISACATRDITPWTRSAWRRRTAPGVTTSGARTRPSKPVWSSRCAGTRRSTSSGATRSSPGAENPSAGAS